MLGGQKKEAVVGEPQGEHLQQGRGRQEGMRPAPSIHNPRASLSTELRALVFANIDFPLWTLQH